MRFITFCIWLFCFSAFGATYYVRTNGSDSANGLTPATAYLSIGRAITNGTSGDTILVGVGRFEERLYPKAGQTLAAETNAVSPAAGVTNMLTATNWLSPTADGFPSCRGAWIVQNNVTMRGFEVKEVNGIGVLLTNAASGWRGGISVRKTTNCLIELNYLHDLECSPTYAGGIFGDDYNTNGVVRSNLCVRCQGSGLLWVGQNSFIYGNDVSRTINTLVATNGYNQGLVVDTDADATRLFGNGNVFSNNFVHDIWYSDNNTDAGDPHPDGMMSFTVGQGGISASNNIIEANLFKFISQQCIITSDNYNTTNQMLSYWTVRNNIFWDWGDRGKDIHHGAPSDGNPFAIAMSENPYLKLENNTFIRDALWSGQTLYTNMYGTNFNGRPVRLRNFNTLKFDGGHFIANNILYGFDAGAGFDWGSNTNTLWNTVVDFQCWQTNYTSPTKPPNQDANTLFGVDPLLSNPSQGVFTLLANSPARNAGTNLSSSFTWDYAQTNRPSSGNWDIGAYQFFVGGVPPVATNGVSVNSLSFVLSRLQNGSQTFYVTNTGGGTLTGTASVSTAYFTLSGTGTNYTLAASTSTNITVSFGPNASGIYGDTVTLTGGGGASVILSGTSTNFPTASLIGKVSTIGKVMLQ